MHKLLCSLMRRKKEGCKEKRKEERIDRMKMNEIRNEDSYSLE